ncbi:MAG: hypothetical protein H0T90_09180 [Gemmatimonadales bacterium]|nr:hypothetical protein [Gemmatimonadales bacterium]
MGKLTFATALLLGAAAGCGDRESGEGGAGDGRDTLSQAPAAVPEAQQSSDASADAGDFGFEQRQDFVATIRQRLATKDQQIEELTAQAKSTGGSVSDRALANIRAARQAVNRNLGRVDNATAANWQEVRNAVTDAVDALTEAAERAQPK